MPVPATNRYLSYLAMVVPSNDLFVGNGNPLGVELFDGGGNFLGPQTINIFGGSVWDAGTEVNDATNGAAFIVGQTATDGADENGTIGLFLDRPDAAAYLASLLGVTTPAGYDISELLSAQGLIATIHIQEVPEPGSLALAGIGAGILGLLIAKRRRRPNARRALGFVSVRATPLPARSTRRAPGQILGSGARLPAQLQEIEHAVGQQFDAVVDEEPRQGIAPHG